MQIGELLQVIERCGWSISNTDRKLNLHVPPGAEEPHPRVLAALKENRQFFLSRQEPEAEGQLPILEPPYECQQCERFIHCADPVVVYATCDSIVCPFYQPEFPPAWAGKARYFLNKQIAEARVAQKSLAEGIPE